MTTNPDADLQQCEVCGAYYEVTDPNVLDYYVHLHLKPEEVIDQLTVPALHEYLIAVIGERWPDQLLLKYGVDGVRLALHKATVSEGLAFAKGGIRTPAAFLRWLLKTAPPTSGPQVNPFNDAESLARGGVVVGRQKKKRGQYY